MLVDYNFRIYYKKGSENAKADAFNRRFDYREKQQNEMSSPVFITSNTGTLEHPV